jgi:peroxiredoxin
MTFLFGAWLPQESSALKIGEAAPALRLNDHTGKAIAVGGESDLWTVLAFYPKAATPG